MLHLTPHTPFFLREIHHGDDEDDQLPADEDPPVVQVSNASGSPARGDRGRLRSCLYFGAGLQPEGRTKPHGSQISKSIAPPRPPWTPPAPLGGWCSNLQKNATPVFGPRGGDLQRALIEAPDQPTVFTRRRVWKCLKYFKMIRNLSKERGKIVVLLNA